MQYKTYCWSIGTTSFRVNELNTKISEQLVMLKELFEDNPKNNWPDLQEKYYDKMKFKKFIEGEAKIKKKDARQKTSGLCDIGVIDSQRVITNVGTKLLNLNTVKDNIFGIDKDNYLYLLQLLKYEITKDGTEVKPFLYLIYLIKELKYLTIDEFKYLLPICFSKSDLKELVKTIKTSRSIDGDEVFKKQQVDSIIINRLLNMDNYKSLLNYFISQEEVTEEVIMTIGINRKSKQYDKPYLNIYQSLLDLYKNVNNYTKDKQSEFLRKLFDKINTLNSNVKGYWKKYFFGKSIRSRISADNNKNVFDKLIFKMENLKDFKIEFFKLMHLFKAKATLEDYYDLNRRYFKLSDIIKFKNSIIELSKIPELFFRNKIDDLIDLPFLSETKYEEKFHDFLELEEINEIYKFDKEKFSKEVKNELGFDISTSSATNYMENLKLTEFRKLVQSKYTNEKLIATLEALKNRKDKIVADFVTNDATPSTIFEYILGIVWWKISAYEGNILEFMNCRLDISLLPKSHAPGGRADIEYVYGKTSAYNQHNLLLEATLSYNTNQRNMEMEPVSRHLANTIIKSNNNLDYVIFVASEIDFRLIMDFRMRAKVPWPKNKEGTDFIKEGLKIIPLSIDNLINIIKTNMNYKTIYEKLDTAYHSNVNIENWYKKEIKDIF